MQTVPDRFYRFCGNCSSDHEGSMPVVDGRYFVQAAVQLQGTSVKMMKMGQEGVPSVAGYLEAEVPENGVSGL